MFQLISASCPVLSLLLLVLVAFPAGAQLDTGSLRGLALDPQRRGIPGVMIYAERIGTSRTWTTQTQEDGTYALTSLPPGEYRIRASAKGFRPVERYPVAIEVQSPRQLDLDFQIETTEMTLAVSAEGAFLNLADARVGSHLTGGQITQLPLEGRNVLALLSLQPGVVYTSDTNVLFRTNFGEPDADARNGAVNGGRSDHANVTLDGLDVNDHQTGFAFHSVLRVGAESIQEFRMVTAGQGAEVGRSSGAQVALVTRSGSNEFHGALFHAHRNTVFSANSFLGNRANLPRAKLIRNTYGGAAGGPLIRNRLFVFGSFEGRRDASETSVIRNVPTADLRNGFVRYRNRAGAIATLSPNDLRRIDPLGIGVNRGTIELMQLYPLPNDSPNIDPLNFGGFRFNSPVRDSLNAGTLRLDYHLSGAHQLFARGNLQTDTGLAALQFPNTPPPFRTRNNSKAVAAGHTWTVSPSTVNAFRYGYVLNKVEDIGTTTGPLFSFGGGVGAPVPLTYSRGRLAPAHQLVNDITTVGRRHTLQAGLNFRFLTNNRYNVEPNRALYVTQVSRLARRGAELLPADIASPGDDFVRAAIMALGVVSQGNTPVNYDQQGNIIPPGTPLRRTFVTNEFEWYGQDSWRVRRNLTLNLGLRYSLYTPVKERAGLAVRPNIPIGDWFELRRRAAENGRPSTSVPAIAYELAGQSGNSGFTGWDRNNFAPRLSAAWAPSSGWSIRGGFGVHYDRVGSSSIALYDSLGSFGLNSTQVNPAGSVDVSTAPRFISLGSSYPSLEQPRLPFRFPLEYPRAPVGLVGAVIPAPDTSLRTPFSLLSNVSVQKQIGRAWVAEAVWVNRTSRNLLALFDSAAPLNLRDPQSGITYFDAVRQLNSQAGSPLSSIRPVAYWENLLPDLSVMAGTLAARIPAFAQRNPGIPADTRLSATQTAYFLFEQLNPGNALAALRNIDVTCVPACGRLGRYSLYNDQFASLFSWRSIAPASYDALQLALRRRSAAGVTIDANYTLSRARDWTSGAERGDAFSRSFVINSWNPSQMWAPADFDLRHQFNANWVAPIQFGSGVRQPAGFLLAGWQVAGIFRWSSGFPVTVQNGAGFSTNHYFRGFGKLEGTAPAMTTNKNAPLGPNLFANPGAAAGAYRFPLPGETGDRNSVRGDGIFNLDLGIGKHWSLPGLETHQVALRWEVFNVTNTARFDVLSANLTVGQAGFGTYNKQLGSPRVMQFLLRYTF